MSVAKTKAARKNGLQHIGSLAENEGMLFSYSSKQPTSSAFWMYRTLIPLDIAFVSRKGTIVSILTMEPCESDNPADCPLYRSQSPYRYALEVNKGYFQRHNVAVGDRLHLKEPTPCQSRPTLDTSVTHSQQESRR